MSVYLIAALTKHDLAKYQEYGAKSRASLEPFPGSILGVDDSPVLIEGDLPGARMVLLKFANNAAFEEWWNSPEYQAAIPFRHEAAETHFMIKVQGVSTDT
jgi:uncharacterized protein (DUF1330 family)